MTKKTTPQVAAMPGMTPLGVKELSGPGLKRLRNSPKAETVRKAVIADQEKAAKAAARPNGHGGKAAMTADPKKEGVPVELQTQNRKDTPEVRKASEEWMAKAGANAKVEADERAAQEKAFKDAEDIRKAKKTQTVFAKLKAKKADQELIDAGAKWDQDKGKWVLPKEVVALAEIVTKEYNELVKKLLDKGIKRWKYKPTPFLNVEEGKIAVGVMKAKLEGKAMVEGEKKPRKPRATGESDEALLQRPFVFGTDVKRQPESARTKRWENAKAFATKNKKCTLGDVVAKTDYTVGDYRLDILRGSVK